MAVSFVYGAQSQYDSLKEQSQILEEALYFVNDTNRIYRGEELIVKTPIKFVTEVPSENLEPDMVYVVTSTDPETQNKTVHIYTSDGESVTEATDSEGNVDVADIFNKLSKFTSADVKANLLDTADDTKLATAGAVKEALTWTILSD